MQRHTPSFILSIFIHLLFAGVIYLVYSSVSTLLSTKKEQKICIKLGTIQAHKEQIRTNKSKLVVLKVERMLLRKKMTMMLSTLR